MNNLALLTGGVGIAGIISIILFYTIGGIFGPINDVCNALMAVVTLALAGQLRAEHKAAPAQAPEQSGWALAALWTGALIAVLGTILVIFRVTGWFLAGLVSTFGYAFVGVWLWNISRSAQRTGAWPKRLAQWGQITGGLMSLGFFMGPAIASRVDDMAAAPAWVRIFMISGLGWFLLYPLWNLWLGRQRAAQRQPRRA